MVQYKCITLHNNFMPSILKNKTMTVGVLLVVLLGVGALLGWNTYLTKLSQQNSAYTEIENNFASNNIDEAIRKSEELLAANPNDIEALSLLASSYAQKGSLEFKEKEYGIKAIEAAKKAIKLDPTNSEAFRVLGYAYEIMGDFSSAITNYNAAISLNGGSAAAYSNRGHAYWLMGDLLKAQQDYEKALSIDSSLAYAQATLARIYISEAKYAQARDLLMRATKNAATVRQKAEIEQLIGMSYLSEFKYDESINHFNAAINIDGTLESAWASRAYARFYSLAESSTSTRSEEAFVGVVESVFADLEQTTKINPNYAHAYYLAAKVSELLGQKVQASHLYDLASQKAETDITLNAADKQGLKELISEDIKNIK